MGGPSALTKTNPPALTFTDPPSAQVNGVGHGRLFPAKPAALHQAAVLIPTVRPPARTAGPMGPTGRGARGVITTRPQRRNCGPRTDA